MTGKSQIAITLAKIKYKHNPNIRIGCTSESVYNMLLEHIPEDNLVKCWENRDNEIREFWYDEMPYYWNMDWLNLKESKK